MDIYDSIPYRGRMLLVRKIGENWQVEVEGTGISSAICQEKSDAIKDAKAIADKYR